MKAQHCSVERMDPEVFLSTKCPSDTAQRFFQIISALTRANISFQRCCALQEFEYTYLLALLRYFSRRKIWQSSLDEERWPRSHWTRLLLWTTFSATLGSPCRGFNLSLAESTSLHPSPCSLISGLPVALCRRSLFMNGRKRRTNYCNRSTKISQMHFGACSRSFPFCCFYRFSFCFTFTFRCMYWHLNFRRRPRTSFLEVEVRLEPWAIVLDG